MRNQFSPSFDSHQKGNHHLPDAEGKKNFKKKYPNKTPWLESNLFDKTKEPHFL